VILVLIPCTLLLGFTIITIYKEHADRVKGTKDDLYIVENWEVTGSPSR
jgi:hypothetical protein